jgi:hypothetical protein
VRVGIQAQHGGGHGRVQVQCGVERGRVQVQHGVGWGLVQIQLEVRRGHVRANMLLPPKKNHILIRKIKLKIITSIIIICSINIIIFIIIEGININTIICVINITISIIV